MTWDTSETRPVHNQLIYNGYDQICNISVVPEHAAAIIYCVLIIIFYFKKPYLLRKIFKQIQIE